ncbi:Transposase family Tnp2 protein [Rhizoctonia solani]|uniref:Transposase family Tnp2 protein n=1 Tax=Rhizoctonia solani TaxID=456999 RepID=A0A8H8SZP6_9AGAM|nr:Transposase family Tnp2 protein [Rhizoctonia solani]QRW22827.1 Transposase family Tnp2 protein [Rhizoctonia solani]
MGLSTTGTLVKPSSSLVYTLNLYYVLKYNDHLPKHTVSRRTRRRCIDRIDSLHWRQAAHEQDVALGFWPSTSVSADPVPPSLNDSTLEDDLDIDLEPPPPQNHHDDDDTTLPTWGLPNHEAFDYGALNQESFQSDLELDDNSDFGVETAPQTPIYDPEMDWASDLGYTSANSRAASPTVGLNIDQIGNNLEDEAPQVPLTPDAPDLELNEETAQEPNIDTPMDCSELPDGLRVFKELLLKFSSDGNLTVTAAEAFLKTINMCLEKGLLQCGSESNPAHRLPMTLETLQRHAGDPPDIMNVYAKTIRHRGSRKVTYRYTPILQYAFGSVKRQLKSILERPGILEAINKHREYLRREGKPDNVLEDIQDGELWRNFQKGDTKFFENPHNIGLILMCDGFSPATRQGAASYSMGAISMCIANLPPDLRNRPENKILVGVTPGPHEPNVNTINNFLKPMVSELLELWKEGMSITHPDGTLEVVFAALVACACDTPAARKVGGFPGTGAQYPCTACWCLHKEFDRYDKKFPRRSRKEHKCASKAYKLLPNKTQKENFISADFQKDKPGGYWYSVLLRLPYWDPSTMVIVDPMHCLFLDNTTQTLWATASCLATIDLPIAIPILWDKVDISSVEQQTHKAWAKLKEAEEKKKAELRKGDKVTCNAAKARQRALTNTNPTTRPQKRQHTTRVGNQSGDSNSDLPLDACDVANLEQTKEVDADQRGFISWRLQDADGILFYQQLSNIYALAQSGLRGAEQMRPNHHGSSHLPEQIVRYGPMSQIWTYSDNIETSIACRASVLLKLAQIDAFYSAFVQAQPDIPIQQAAYKHGNAPVLELEVNPLREVKHRGCIFSMSSFCDSIIKAVVMENGQLAEQVGKIIDIWEHKQAISSTSSVSNTFVLVQWYKASPIFALQAVWLWTVDFPDANVEIYVPDQYLDWEAIIPVSNIQCHCAWMTVNIDNCPVWVAIGLDQE